MQQSISSKIILLQLYKGLYTVLCLKSILSFATRPYYVDQTTATGWQFYKNYMNTCVNTTRSSGYVDFMSDNSTWTKTTKD